MANFKDIQLLRTTFLRGPSVWTYRPILEVWLDLGELEDYPSNKLPGLNERLTAWLPDLVEHTCGVGERGGFIQRLTGGTWMGHVLEHVVIELLNLSGMTGFIAWLGIAISHYRFRKGYVAQGLQLSALPYRTTSFPFGPIFAFVLCMTITLGQNYQAFLQERIDWTGVVATYIGLPLFLVIWFGYRLVKGSRIVPYAKMQVKPEAY